MAAAYGRLYVSLADGGVACLGDRSGGMKVPIPPTADKRGTQRPAGSGRTQPPTKQAPPKDKPAKDTSKPPTESTAAEQEARKLLDKARTYHAGGLHEKAWKALQDCVRLYPDTQAGKYAKRLMTVWKSDASE